MRNAILALLSALIFIPTARAQDTTVVEGHVPGDVILALLVSRSDVLLDSARISPCSLKKYLGPAYADSLGPEVAKLLLNTEGAPRCENVLARDLLTTIFIESVRLATDTGFKAHFGRRDSVFTIQESTAFRSARSTEIYVIKRLLWVPTLPSPGGWRVVKYEMTYETNSH
jgi:hypothetical protein